MTDTTLAPTTRGGSGDSAGNSSNATLAGLNPAWPTR